MYDIIFDMIGHTWETSNSMQQYIVYTCCVLVIILTVVFIDMIYRVFSHFWRG